MELFLFSHSRSRFLRFFSSAENKIATCIVKYTHAIERDDVQDPHGIRMKQKTNKSDSKLLYTILKMHTHIHFEYEYEYNRIHFFLSFILLAIVHASRSNVVSYAVVRMLSALANAAAVFSSYRVY